MKRFSIIVLMILLSFGVALPLNAQNRKLLMGMSALLPGSGEIAMGNTNRGVVLLSSELIAGYTFFKTNKDMSLQKDQYMRYANLYAGVPMDMPAVHYQAIQNYISSEEYNDLQEMSARNYFLIYKYDPDAFAEYVEAHTYSGDETWEWRSKEHWSEYKAIRRKHQYSRINHNLALGVMLLNRGISLIETALLSREINVSAKPFGADGMTLSYELRF